MVAPLVPFAVMVENDGNRSRSLETWSSTAFLASGGLFVVFAGLWGAFAFTDMASRTAQDVVGPAGWTVAFVGLLALYPGLVDRSPRLSRAGAVFAGLGVLGAAVSTAGNLVELLESAGALPEWFAALQLLIMVGIIPGFLAFAFASLRAGGQERRVGRLLLAPAAIFAVNVVRVMALGSTTPTWAPFVLGGGQAVAMLAVGYALRTGAPTADGPASAADATAR